MSRSVMLDLLRHFAGIASMQPLASICDRYGADYVELTKLHDELMDMDLGEWVRRSRRPSTIDWYVPFTLRTDAINEADSPDVTWFTCSMWDSRSVSVRKVRSAPPDVLVVGEWRHDLGGAVSQTFVRKDYLRSPDGRTVGKAVLKARLAHDGNEAGWS